MPVRVIDNTVILENCLFRREIAVDQDGLRTVSIVNKTTGREHVKRPDVAEFQLTLDDTVVASYSKPEPHVVDGNMHDHGRPLKLEDIGTCGTPSGGELAMVSFLCPAFPARIKVCYEIHPDLPGCSKWIEVDCLGQELRLHQLFFEMLNACPGEFADAVFLKHGIVKAPPSFASSGDEDAIQLHNPALGEGMLIGNGAPGLLRYFMVYPHWPSGIACGYNMGGADFNKFLRRGERFVSDKAYLCLYEGDVHCAAGLNAFREMIRRDLPPCNDHGGAMYCTWLPFLKNIDEALLMELTERAAALGFTWFVVDDGWFVDDNWEVDRSKFPRGLKPIADKVHQAGMKFGLWLNVGNDYGQAGSRPEDNALDYHGKPKLFGLGGKLETRCFASAHREVMAEKLKSLAKEYGVDYFKLDFSNICSPYGVMPYGCSSTQHQHHRDLSDSVTEQYLSMMHMRDAVKKEFPGIVLDFSFEAFGMEFPSIGALRYSELHHSSNMDTLRPEILKAEKIRRTLYQYCNLLPNERILGSLLCLQDERAVEHLLTALVTTPLVAGDLRAIPPVAAPGIKTVLSEFNRLANYKPLTEFQLLNNGPQHWDGYARHHKDGDGMICVFRNSFTGASVDIALDNIPDGIYSLRGLLAGDEEVEYLGEALRSGIKIGLAIECPCEAFVLRRTR